MGVENDQNSFFTFRKLLKNTNTNDLKTEMECNLKRHQTLTKRELQWRSLQRVGMEQQTVWKDQT